VMQYLGFLEGLCRTCQHTTLHALPSRMVLTTALSSRGLRRARVLSLLCPPCMPG
jgi:hypothetical protein